MVQTDVSQLIAECADWRQILRKYREELQDSKKALQPFCRNNLTKSQLQEIEHFDNQFHIQLINIHDLKQVIKMHEKSLQGDDLADEVYARHEQLLDQFIMLEHTLQELRSQFLLFSDASAY
jgi:hypothetical protein